VDWPKKERGMVPNLNAWMDFITEARLDVEFTTFMIEKRGGTSSGLVHGIS
jgi:hypothetical protein